MKYHIHFGEDYTLSFDILDNPVAQAWVDIMQKKLSDENVTETILRTVFPSKTHPVRYFNQIKYFYNDAKKKGLDLEFDLNDQFHSYTDADYNYLDSKIDYIYKKVIEHNYYFNTDPDLLEGWKACVRGLKEYKDCMLDCKYNKENYALIKLSNSSGDSTEITSNMKKKYCIESERPKIVLRLAPNVELKTLELMERRNYPQGYKNNILNTLQFITSDYKICYYENELTNDDAIKFMKSRRESMSKFVKDNNINTEVGYFHNYYFVNPVVGHCIDNTITQDDIFKLFTDYTEITSEFEE